MRLALIRLTFVGVFLLAVSLSAAAAQSPEKAPRIGYISPGSSSDPVRLRRLEAFRQGLRELGYVEGQNIILETRWAEGQYARYPALVGDLVRLKVSVIVTVGGAGAKAAKQGTSAVPIVMSSVIDPVETGLVPSLARPGGNVTGTSIMSPDLVGKQFELLREVVPKASRMSFLWNPGNPTHARAIRDVKVAAQSLGVELQLFEARDPQEIDRAFGAMTRSQVGAVLILPDAVFTNQARQIAELALQKGFPSTYG